MKDTIAGSVRTALLLALVTAACLAIALVGGTTPARAASGTYQYASSSPDATCPAGGQCFADVTAANSFYANINALYMDDIIGGYACGGPGEPCDSENRPYYRPGNNVTRQQMAKFADLGRRNIADAVGIRLHLAGNATGVTLNITTTNLSSDGLHVDSPTGAEAIQGSCTRSVLCYGIYGTAVTGGRAGLFSGGRGLYAAGGDDNYPAFDANTSAAGAYGVDAYSANYRSVRALNNNASWYGLYVDTSGSTVGAYVNGNGYINGNLTVTGTCCLAGNVVQNADTATLQPGDVVTIVGTSPAVLGEHPVITVKKASSAYDTGVVGIIDAPLYVPDAQTRATYEAEQQAVREVTILRKQGMSAAEAAGGSKFDEATIPMPELTVTDAQGTVHTDVASRAMTTNTYANIVTSGSYQSVKVDASYGAIKAGDLLVSSPNPGYAMKATDMAQANGAIIGKALGSLDSGTGTVPVMVILK